MEVWCLGNHRNVGGVYYNNGLSNTFLHCMAKDAEVAGMKLHEFMPKMTRSTIVDMRSVVQNFAEFDTATLRRSTWSPTWRTAM